MKQAVSRTLIQKYATSVVRDFVERANDLKDLKHRLTKGELKELFVSRVLNTFLTSQFGIGSGIVINKNNKQSYQTDIIIYDNRILPPFIREQNIGVYPAESVIATVEIKTKLNLQGLCNAEKAATHLVENVFGNVAYGFTPLCAVFGFDGSIVRLKEESTGKGWLSGKVKNVFNICIAGKYSWANVGGKGWTLKVDQTKTFEGAKRFIALLLDNARTVAQERFRYFVEGQHWDWFSAYIRE